MARKQNSPIRRLRHKLFFSHFFILLLLTSIAYFSNISGGECVDYTQDINCQGAWLLDDGSGTTPNDSSVNNYEGTFGGTPTWETVSPPVASSTSYLHFNASPDWVGFGDILNFTSAISMVSWIKLDATGSREIFIGKGTFIEAADSQYWLEVRDTGRIGFYLSDNSPADHLLIGTTTIVSDTNWHFITGTYDGTTQKVYVDGVIDGTTLTWSVNLNVAVGKLFRFSRGGELGSLFFDGSMDEVVMFDDALTSTEINDIMDNGLKPGAARRMWTFQ